MKVSLGAAVCGNDGFNLTNSEGQIIAGACYGKIMHVDGGKAFHYLDAILRVNTPGIYPKSERSINKTVERKNHV